MSDYRQRCIECLTEAADRVQGVRDALATEQDIEKQVLAVISIKDAIALLNTAAEFYLASYEDARAQSGSD